MTLLIDTGAVIALMDRSEPRHQIVLELLSSCFDTLVTCEAVVAEACHLLRRVKGASGDLLKNIDLKQLEIPYCLADRTLQVARLMRKYADVPMDLADACLVDMASIFNTGRILTLDADFRVYRWGRNRPFDLLVDL
jgi:predicted nucleic acid-binding protein